MRKLPDWACANELFAHVLDDKKQTCEFTVELKLAGEATDNRNKVASEAIRFFFATNLFATEFSFATTFISVTTFFASEFFVVAKVFFVTGTIVPIPIPCVPVFLWKPA